MKGYCSCLGHCSLFESHIVRDPVKNMLRYSCKICKSPISPVTSGRYAKYFPSYAAWTVMDFGIDFAGILLCENRKWDKIRMLCRGMLDSMKREEV